jgi:predicted O-methyltransferase YrrM
VLEAALAIKGWTKVSELEFLYETAASMPENARVVEVGSWRGRSAVAICTALAEKSDPRFWAVDTFRGDSETEQDVGPVQGDEIKDEFLRNVANFDFVETVVADSREASREFEPGSLDWIFIDGDHTYPSVIADIKCWAPKLKPGGLLSGHDYGRSGVTDAVRRSIRDFGQSGSIWYTREPPRLQLVRALKIAVRRRLR